MSQLPHHPPEPPVDQAQVPTVGICHRASWIVPIAFLFPVSFSLLVLFGVISQRNIHVSGSSSGGSQLRWCR